MINYSALAVGPTTDDWILAQLPAADAMVARHGRYLALTTKHEQVEEPATRRILLEWPSKEAAQAFTETLTTPLICRAAGRVEKSLHDLTKGKDELA